MWDRVRFSFMVKFNDGLIIFTFICVKAVNKARLRESLEVHLVALGKTELLHIFHEFVKAG